MYMALKHSHMGFAYLSVILFVLRFALAYYKPALNSNKVLNIVTHGINALLLITAAMLCLQLQQYPFTDGWVTAKFLGLVVYVVLGVIAMKKASLKMFVAALVVFAYLIGTAKAHSALSWLAVVFA
ncbi:SirB2 family protein [uncultured Thalassolituus sp.]|uniref:SirB2 family protein n=1 Tax=uncultured Thalassolituus sp. TaxID=285273 RepID=UPI00261C32B7|nr:SirB2 family protein [uncultured Thalassolituus sp.]